MIPKNAIGILERKTMFELADGYSYDVEGIDRSSWHKLSARFEDLNIYQTWEYGAAHFGQTNSAHLVLRKGDTPVAVAQARILEIPFVQTGVAYVRWGPLWNSRRCMRNQEDFRQMVRALRNEFVVRRSLLLRLFPVLYEGEDGELGDMLCQEGYVKQKHKERKRTLILDLRPDESELRKNLNQKWRNCLNQAERNQLELVEGPGENLFDQFIGLYQGLLERKKFAEPNDIRKFRGMQMALPPEQKMRVFLCRGQDGNGSGAVISALGDMGLYLYGATSEKGMGNKASYFVQWKIIQWLKEAGYHYYDLNGINPARNPGTYHFKAGLAGKAGSDVIFLGHYDSFKGLRGRIISAWGDVVFSNIFKRSPQR